MHVHVCTSVMVTMASLGLEKEAWATSLARNFFSKYAVKQDLLREFLDLFRGTDLILCNASLPVQVRSIAMSVSVCLSTCVPQKAHVQTSQNFLHTLLVAVARSSSDDSMYFRLCG